MIDTIAKLIRDELAERLGQLFHTLTYIYPTGPNVIITGCTDNTTFIVIELFDDHVHIETVGEHQRDVLYEDPGMLDQIIDQAAQALSTVMNKRAVRSSS